MNLKSIRWRLPLSYAGIALLAAIASGVLMLTTLRGYYQRQERAYLESNAQQISLVAAQLLKTGLPNTFIADQTISWSFLLQARVQLLDEQGQPLADSGSPDIQRILMVSSLPAGVYAGGWNSPSVSIVPTDTMSFTISETMPAEQVSAGGDLIVFDFCPPDDTGNLPAECVSPPFQMIYRAGGGIAGTAISFTAPITQPLSGEVGAVGVAMPSFSSVYGYDLSASDPEFGIRSNQRVAQPIRDEGEKILGTLILSEGLAYGSEIITSVARAWVLASAAALAIAIGAGWWISRRMSAPLLSLTEVTARMTAGELSARAGVVSNDEFGTLGRSFNEMADQVETIISTLRSFVADAAHELNTPLTALRTDLELAGGAANEGERGPMIAHAQEQLQRLQGLVGSLLDLSRIEGRAADPLRQPVNLSELAQMTSETYASRAEQSGIGFELVLPDDPLVVMGDAGQLRQALANLLDNALKFTPAGGSISLRLARRDDRAVLAVEDSGIGIPPEDAPHLFERFHRGRNASSYPGSGLGLAIVRAVAELHGGQVQAFSEGAGCGSQVTLEIPVLLG